MGFPYANLFICPKLFWGQIPIKNDEDTHLRLNRVTGELTLYTAGSVFFMSVKVKTLF